MPNKKTETKPANSKAAKKTSSLREAAEKQRAKQAKPRRLKQTASASAKPIKSAVHFGKREYYIPLPDNTVGRFLNKKRRFVPKYFRESWAELRQVTWPDRKTTVRLTIAVFIFAIAFALMIAVVDYGLDKIFRKVIL